EELKHELEGRGLYLEKIDEMDLEQLNAVRNAFGQWFIGSPDKKNFYEQLYYSKLENRRKDLVAVKEEKRKLFNQERLRKVGGPAGLIAQVLEINDFLGWVQRRFLGPGVNPRELTDNCKDWVVRAANKAEPEVLGFLMSPDRREPLGFNAEDLEKDIRSKVERK
ncbi:MAG: hypothetical protein AAB815_01425, partial [Patescibacteria group bacterium]